MERDHIFMIIIYFKSSSKNTNSIFIHELNDEEKKSYDERQKRNQNRINISSQIITTLEKIAELSERIRIIPKFQYLCDIEKYKNYYYPSIIQEILSQQHNDAKLLTKMLEIPYGYYDLRPH